MNQKIAIIAVLVLLVLATTVIAGCTDMNSAQNTKEEQSYQGPPPQDPNDSPSLYPTPRKLDDDDKFKDLKI